MPWQRCQFHLQQNAGQYVPTVALRAPVAADIRAIFNAPDQDEAQRLLERFVERYREVHALEDHGVTPKLPEGADRGAHRVFAHSVADAPRMWSTHPSNQDREKNCKARYFPSALDPRPAWSVFRDPDTLRARLTAHFLDLATREEKAAYQGSLHVPNG